VATDLIVGHRRGSRHGRRGRTAGRARLRTPSTLCAGCPVSCSTVRVSLVVAVVAMQSHHRHRELLQVLRELGAGQGLLHPFGQRDVLNGGALDTWTTIAAPYAARDAMWP
jgi:hypothetical protein